MRRTRLAAAVAGAVLATVVVAGCGGGGDESTSEGAGRAVAPADGSGAAKDADTPPQQGGSGGSEPAITRAIIRTGYLTIEASDLDAARQKLGTIVAGVRGLIASEHSEADADGNVSRTEVVIRVPADVYDATVQRLQKDGLGKVTQIRQESSDVTEQVADVDSRVANQRSSIERMRALMARANTIAEIVSVEGELTRREAELESLLAKQKALKGQTELATITVTLAKPGEAPKKDERGFLAGLRNGWNAFVTSVSALATGVGAVLPFAITLGIIAVPIWLAYRARRARTATPPPTPTE